jgi:hypothetical protein
MQVGDVRGEVAPVSAFHFPFPSEPSHALKEPLAQPHIAKGAAADRYDRKLSWHPPILAQIE